MRTLQRYVLLAFLCCAGFGHHLNAQNCRIEGVAVVENTPAAGAHISLDGLDLSSLCGGEGEFFLELPAGRYTLRAVLEPFEASRTIELRAGDTLSLRLQLQRSGYDLDAIVVSASRNPQRRSEAPVLVNISDHRIFDATRALSLSEGLSFQPGLRIENNCQNCGYSQLRINGLEGAYSQILIDGKPIFGAMNSIYGLDQIPAEMLERVEVVRGGGSALYGANAIAGTINLITRDPSENRLQAGLHHTLTGLRAAENTASLHISRVSQDRRAGLTAFGLGRLRSPYDHDGDGFTEISKLQNGSGGFKAFFKPASGTRISAEGHLLREFRRGGNRLALPPHLADIGEQIQSRAAGGSLSAEHYSLDLKHKWSAYLSGQRSAMDNYYGAGGDPDGYGNTADGIWASGLQYTRRQDRLAGKPGVFTAGLEYRYNRMADQKPGYGLFVDQSLRLFSFYSQQEWQAHSRLKLSAGLRYDRHNLSGRRDQVSPRLALLWHTGARSRLRLSYSRGFRPPQVFSPDVHVQIAGGEILAIRLAQDLQTERSASYTAGWEFAPLVGGAPLEIGIEGFYTLLQRPFVLEEIPASPFPILEKRNGAALRVAGLHLEARYAPSPALWLQGSMTLQHNRYAQPLAWALGQETPRLLRTPAAYGNFVAQYAPGRNWQFSASAVITGRMWVPHFAGAIPQDRLEHTPAFFELNLKADKDLVISKKSELCLSFGLFNLLNSYQRDFDRGPERDASYIYGPMRPRGAFAGLVWKGG